MKNQWLLTLTGPDKPGLLSQVCRTLAEGGAEMLDIQQVTIAPLLVIALQIGLPEREWSEEVAAEKQAALLGRLTMLTQELNLNLKIQPFSPTPESDDRPENYYAVTCVAPNLSPGALCRITGVLGEIGVNIERITKLNEQELKAIELTVRVPVEVDRRTLKRRLFEISNEVKVDIAVQPESLFRRSKRLIVMDVDSTLVQHEAIDELARVAGVEQEVAQLTAEAMAGQLDFASALHRRVALLKGLPVSRLAEVEQVLQLTPGAERLIRVLKKLGYKTAIVSGGFTFFTDRLKARLKLDYAYANTLEIEGDYLTGRLTGPIIDAHGKARLLREIAAAEDIALEQTLAVGDGANDLLMLETAGLGVAFNAKPVVREAADLFISQPSLDVLLYLIGIRDQEVHGL